MRKSILTAVIVAAGLGLAGCSGSAKSAQPEAKPVVALIDGVLEKDMKKVCTAFDPDSVLPILGGQEGCVKQFEASKETVVPPKGVDKEYKVASVEKIDDTHAKVTLESKEGKMPVTVTKNKNGNWYLTINDLSSVQSVTK